MNVLLNEAEETGTHTLKKTLTARGLVALGIGAIIGAGLFSITGMAAANHAGPAITKITLATTANVPAIDNAKFQEIAEQAKRNCPVSKVLSGAEISLDAKLIS